MASREVVEIVVNGEPREAAVAPHRTLLELLRDDFGLTGTKRGCDDASCGSCTVLVDGRPHLACISLALCLDGSNVLTIEGTAPAGLSALQESLLEEGGLQCGYCTPGIVLAAQAILDRTAEPSDDEIREGISNNLCRCTGYNRIVDAVKKTIPRLVPARSARSSAPGSS